MYINSICAILFIRENQYNMYNDVISFLSDSNCITIFAGKIKAF